MSTKTKRLDRADIERRINEMFDALEGTAPEDLNETQEHADDIARRMRARVDSQDRLDLAAPALLAACKRMVWVFGSMLPGMDIAVSTAGARMELDQAIALAELPVGPMPPPPQLRGYDLAAPPPAPEPEPNPFEGHTAEPLLRALRQIRAIGEACRAAEAAGLDPSRPPEEEIQRLAGLADKALAPYENGNP